MDVIARQAEDVFQRFRVLPGADLMASPCSIEGLFRLIDQQRPKRILEIGAGIGTLTSVIIAAAPAASCIVTIEEVPFCREQLTTNLGSDLDRLELRDAAENLPGEYDLLVVDGHQLINLVPHVARGGIVFVEGDRWEQRGALAASKREHCVTHIRSLRLQGPEEHGAEGERYHSGYWIFRFEPSPSVRVSSGVSNLWHNTAIGFRRRVRRLCRLERAAP